MVTVIIIVLAASTFVAELWLGFVVIGLGGEKPYIARSENPIQYWLVMAWHLLIATGLPLLAYAAGI